MRVGDPKKAKILAAVAVSAIAFIVIEVMPASAKNKGTASVRNVPTQSEEVAIASSALLRDPFSSKLLIVKPVAKTVVASLPAQGRANSGKDSHPPMGGSIGGGNSGGSEEGDSSKGDPAGPGLPPATGSGGIPPVDPVKGKESMTLNRANVTGPKTVIKLEATMTVQQAVAMISVDSAEATPFRAGQQPFKGVWLMSVSTDGIAILVNKRRIHLDVGGEISL